MSETVTTVIPTTYEVGAATVVDVPAILELYRGLSPRSTRLRFSSHMSDVELAHAADLPGQGCAVVARLGEQVVGEARYVLWEAGHELAMTVADDHQGRGLGRMLLSRLRRTAVANGVRSLRAVVRTENAAMLGLLERVGVSIVRPPEDGDITVDIACDDYMPGWGADTGRTRVLVEARGRAEHTSTTALRNAGFDVRQCTGPGRRDRVCPVLTLGRCRLFEEADLVAYLLPDSEDCAGIGELHVKTHPDRLVARSLEDWCAASASLASSPSAALRPGRAEGTSGAGTSGDVEHLA
jgi:ribosomal protein S18 acetylase RimI-like enzyme